MKFIYFIYLFTTVLVAITSVNCLSVHENGRSFHKFPKAKELNDNTDDEKDPSFWWRLGQRRLKQQLKKLRNIHKAINIIYFLGDGMSIPTVTASRIYKGQLEGNKGEETVLSFENFPYVGLSKTYCVDDQVADSACSATAYLCGVKANSATIGVSANVNLNDCAAGEKARNHVSSLASWAQKEGKATGVVTTTRVTHASPAGTYAHVANRQYESDYDVKQEGQDPSQCQDIAKQLILNKPGSAFNVILGGGRKKFLPNITKSDMETRTGQRLDGIDLIDEWKKDKGTRGQYVNNRDDLLNIDIKTTDYLLGLFNDDHMNYHLDANNLEEPTLAEMTEAAIKLLSKQRRGYFVFIEGGRIDHAHHETKARKSLDETVEFARAIEKAIELTSEKDTLIIVTADHAHTMSFAGYSRRGKDILGLNSRISDVDGLPYTTLSYANGPNFSVNSNGSRKDLTDVDFSDKNYQYPSTVPLGIETHGGDDVAVYASGPWSHIFSGVYEQNVLPHLIGYASCIGEGATVCDYEPQFEKSLNVKS